MKMSDSENRDKIPPEETSSGSPFPPEAVPLLLDWYRANARSLPWRESRDAYRVMVSEVMLQQTRAEAVKPYFTRFIEALPTVSALAEADEDILLKLWEGLGYYSRVRNLQRSAQRILSDCGGVVPSDAAVLRSLPGIGRYTAGAVASIAYDIPVPAVDGNVLRVLARLTADSTDVLSSEAKTSAEEALAPCIPSPGAGDFTQSLIELGALVCLPGEPKCGACPLALLCRARAEGRERDLPVRGAKKARRTEQRIVLVLRPGGEGAHSVVIRRRPAGLLGGLYEFPNFLCRELRDVPCGGIPARIEAFLRGMGMQPLAVRSCGKARHLFTHVEWQMEGFCVALPENTHLPEGWLAVSPADLQDSVALPSAFSAFRTAAGLPAQAGKKRKP